MPAQPASASLIRVVGVVYLLLIVFLVYTLVAFWPATQITRTDGVTKVVDWDPKVTWFGNDFQVPTEMRLLWIVVLTAALGGYVHAVTSFASYVGNSSFCATWIWWYILRTPIGIALALIFYFGVRGGFLSSGATAANMSPFGVAALAGLVGMFSKQATDKLQEVFANLFRTEPGKGDDQRKGKLSPDPVITAIDPASVPQGHGATDVKVTGHGFSQGATVMVNNTPRPTDFHSDTELMAHLVAADTATPGTLHITVKAPPPLDKQSNMVPMQVEATGGPG